MKIYDVLLVLHPRNVHWYVSFQGAVVTHQHADSFDPVQPGSVIRACVCNSVMEVVAFSLVYEVCILHAWSLVLVLHLCEDKVTESVFQNLSPVLTTVYIFLTSACRAP